MSSRCVCIRCNVDLKNRPAIGFNDYENIDYEDLDHESIDQKNIDYKSINFENDRVFYDGIYCFRCAKIIEKYLTEIWKEATEKEYQEAKNREQERKNIYNTEFQKWMLGQDECFKNAQSGNTIFGVTFVIGMFILGNYGWSLGGFFGWIVIALIARYFRRQIGPTANDLIIQYEINYPKPKFIPNTLVKNINKVDIELIEDRSLPDNPPPNDYRSIVLKRDHFTCQNCGAEKSPRNLEVHHVRPQSQAGSDHLVNLITLCKYCHDHENWFGHVRKYPTT